MPTKAELELSLREAERKTEKMWEHYFNTTLGLLFIFLAGVAAGYYWCWKALH